MNVNQFTGFFIDRGFLCSCKRKSRSYCFFPDFSCFQIRKY